MGMESKHSDDKKFSRHKNFSGNSAGYESSPTLPAIVRKYESKFEVGGNSSYSNFKYAESSASELPSASPQDKSRKTPNTLPGRFRNGSKSASHTERFVKSAYS